MQLFRSKTIAYFEFFWVNCTVFLFGRDGKLRYPFLISSSQAAKGTRSKSKSTNHSPLPCYSRWRVSTGPHGLMKTSSKQPKRRDYTVILLSRKATTTKINHDPCALAVMVTIGSKYLIYKFKTYVLHRSFISLWYKLMSLLLLLLWLGLSIENFLLPRSIHICACVATYWYWTASQVIIGQFPLHKECR